jgi:hypothetical protein
MFKGSLVASVTPTLNDGSPEFREPLRLAMITTGAL